MHSTEIRKQHAYETDVYLTILMPYGYVRFDASQLPGIYIPKN